jgi:hypothetical protein
MSRSPLEQLTALGEDVIGRASKNPTAHKVVQGANQIKDWADELQKQLRGLQSVEQRLAALEKRVHVLEGGEPEPVEVADAAADEAPAEPAG